MNPRVLVVDDEVSLVEFLTLLLDAEGYEVASAGNVAEAKEQLNASTFHLVLCDLTMPDGTGLEVLQYLRDEVGGESAVIMMTAYTSTESAIEAMKLGAYDYISKPFNVDELKLLIQKAIERIELYDENAYLRKELAGRYRFGNIIGRSARMQRIFATVEKISKTSSTVLIQGESGTGKELIARAIHFNSPRKARRFLSVNCGALPDELLESELFGHERGAFTGAVKEKQGLFSEAHQGTLFLDEIGEMTPAMQVKLLRALQERTIRKVGGTQEEQVDVRVLAATNRDLEEQIKDGEFREDLFYRINVIPIQLPPLRKRREDIPLLVEHFASKVADQIGVERVPISMEAMRLLEQYDWPGNVRQLENVIERTLALFSGDTVQAEDLPDTLSKFQPSAEGVVLPEDGLDLETYLDDLRLQLMEQALERTGWVQTNAAELVGMTFRSFRYYAKKLGIHVRSKGQTKAEEEDAARILDSLPATYPDEDAT